MQKIANSLNFFPMPRTLKNIAMLYNLLPNTYWIFLDAQLKRFSGNKPHKLTQNGPKRCIFRNVQTTYLGSTMCLWYLPMSKKFTEFFSDLPFKQFSGNKPHKLTQNGPKRCIFRNFQTHYLGSTMCLLGKYHRHIVVPK